MDQKRPMRSYVCRNTNCGISVCQLPRTLQKLWREVAEVFNKMLDGNATQLEKRET